MRPDFDVRTRTHRFLVLLVTSNSWLRRLKVCPFDIDVPLGVENRNMWNENWAGGEFGVEDD